MARSSFTTLRERRRFAPGAVDDLLEFRQILDIDDVILGAVVRKALGAHAAGEIVPVAMKALHPQIGGFAGIQSRKKLRDKAAPMLLVRRDHGRGLADQFRTRPTEQRFGRGIPAQSMIFRLARSTTRMGSLEDANTLAIKFFARTWPPACRPRGGELPGWKLGQMVNGSRRARHAAIVHRGRNRRLIACDLPARCRYCAPGGRRRTGPRQPGQVRKEAAVTSFGPGRRPVSHRCAGRSAAQPCPCQRPPMRDRAPSPATEPPQTRLSRARPQIPARHASPT